MTPMDWTGPVVAVALTVMVIALGYMGLRGGALRRTARQRFVCPDLHRDVDCEMVQDVRTGQWKDVRSCSAFAAGEAIRCDQDCRKVMNGGFTLSPGGRA